MNNLEINTEYIKKSILCISNWKPNLRGSEVHLQGVGHGTAWRLPVLFTVVCSDATRSTSTVKGMSST